MFHSADDPDLPSLRKAARNLDPSAEQRERMWVIFSQRAGGFEATPRNGVPVRIRWLVAGLVASIVVLTTAGFRARLRRRRVGTDGHDDLPSDSSQ